MTMLKPILDRLALSDRPRTDIPVPTLLLSALLGLVMWLMAVGVVEWSVGK
jgi:hypothetical protein